MMVFSERGYERINSWFGHMLVPSKELMQCRNFVSDFAAISGFSEKAKLSARRKLEQPPRRKTLDYGALR